MKKVFLAVLAIAAMMVSCQKEGPVDNQKETPEVEVNEPQPVILGSNLFKAPTTKASVDDMASWKTDDKNIYVYAINNNPADGADKVPIKNVGAKLKDDSGTDDSMTGSLDLKDPDNKPFYYGTSDADIYDFYAYYLGYNLEGVQDYYSNGVITVTDVNINGDNDIMIAETDKAADAVVVDGDGNSTMVNPKYLYSQYSARHNVVPNLVFNHMLSKFSFEVRYDGPLGINDKIYLKKITFIGEKKSGSLVLNKVEGGVEPGLYIDEQENREDVSIDFDEGLELKKANNLEGDNFGYTSAQNLMVVPAGTEGKYQLKIDLEQTFDAEGNDSKTYDNVKEITKDMVVTEDGTPISGFERGKHYRVLITVYGLQEVKINVQLVPWDFGGTITIDSDKKDDGYMKQLRATVTIGDNTKTCTLFAEEFKDPTGEGAQLYDAYCIFDGENKLVSAPQGEYTIIEDPNIATVTVDAEGKISGVTFNGPAPEPEG